MRTLTYLHILRAGMVYITLWYVHVPRYVLGQNCLIYMLNLDLNVPTYLLVLHVHGPCFTAPCVNMLQKLFPLLESVTPKKIDFSQVQHTQRRLQFRLICGRRTMLKHLSKKLNNLGNQPRNYFKTKSVSRVKTTITEFELKKINCDCCVFRKLVETFFSAFFQPFLFILA